MHAWTDAMCISVSFLVHISLYSPSNTGSDLVDYVYVVNDENVPSVGNSFWQKKQVAR